jgi:hypothetical protein
MRELMTRSFVRMVAVGVVALVTASCGASTDPDPVDPGVPESSLHFLTPDAGAPGWLTDTVRFYAVAGQDRRTAIYYQDSVKFMTFDVPAGALIQDPNGNPIATGDSLLITIEIADSSRLIVGFEPSGLEFNAAIPAELTLSFAHAQNSVPQNASTLSLWRQENPGDNWHKVPSNTKTDSLTVSGPVGGFTVYATAY